MNYDWQKLAPQLQAVLDDEIAAGRECGCQLVIYHRGQKVVDLCGGFTGSDHKIPVNNRHLFPIFSSGKAVLAAAMLQAVDRKLFTKDTPVHTLWEGFGCEGKEDITVEHLLSHRAGLYLLPHLDSIEELADWEKMCSVLAAARPTSPAGKKTTYHAITFAYLNGKVLENVLKEPLRDILRKNILTPAGVADEFYFGTDEESEKRFVPIVDAEDITEIPSWCARHMNNSVIRKACVPSFNGCATANGLARFYAAVAGDIPGVRLISEETLEASVTSSFRDEDDKLPDNSWTNFALGMVMWNDSEMKARFFGHGGAAGAEGLYDRKTGIALGFVKNRNIKEHPNHIVRDRLSEILEFPQRHW